FTSVELATVRPRWRGRVPQGKTRPVPRREAHPPERHLSLSPPPRNKGVPGRAPTRRPRGRRGSNVMGTRTRKPRGGTPGITNPPKPGPRKKPLPRGLLLAAVALTAFGATYGLVRLGRSWGLPDAPPGMVWVPGGEFTMGNDDPQVAWPDERPAHRVRVEGF